MKKLLFGTIFLALVLVFPISTMARSERIPLPPRIAFAAAPQVVVIPGTYVYGVPDVDADMFFYQGWWWRLWEGRWYRSHDYNSGWGYYRSAPSFYSQIPSGWKNDYRNHRWGGQQWNYQRIPQQQVKQNWSTWEKSKYWEKHNTWGVKGYNPRGQSQQPSRKEQPKSQEKPQSRETDKQQSNPQQGKPERGEGENRDNRR